MADMTIVVTSLDRETAAAGEVSVLGICCVDGYGPQITWTTSINMGATAVTQNEAIKDAAIAAALVEGQTVGLGDKKTVYGGAVGL